jgi:hypothetical protein
MTDQRYPCHAPGCEKSAQTCMCLSCDEPWLFEFCSRECWNTVWIVDHLRAEDDQLSQIAAEEIEARDDRIANMERIIERLTDAFGVVAVDRALKTK